MLVNYVAERSGQSEVCQDWLTIGSQQNVGWLDVTVNQARGVYRSQGFGHASGNPHRLRLLQRLRKLRAQHAIEPVRYPFHGNVGATSELIGNGADIE